MKRRALIVGATGQDGSYLAELLLAKGYEVHGTQRRSSTFNTSRLDSFYSRLVMHYADVTDADSIRAAVARSKPHEVYNLAAQSHVKVSFDMPVYSCQTDAIGTLVCLEAVRALAPEARFYQASSSEMFGSSPAPQNEHTPFAPCSPYGISKVFAHQTAQMYREAYGMHVSCGILFNHESPRRGETFVTRKITRGATRIKVGLQKTLRLGNLDAMRDWGHAKDYVRAMWLMLQQDAPLDCVVGTGKSHTVHRFAAAVFERLGISMKANVVHDARYDRPLEVDNLQADATRALNRLGWKPAYTFNDIVNEMTDHDLMLAREEKRHARTRHGR